MSVLFLRESYQLQHIQDMARHFTVTVPLNCAEHDLKSMVHQAANVRDAAYKLILGQISWMDYCDQLEMCEHLDLDDHLCGVEDYLEGMGFL